MELGDCTIKLQIKVKEVKTMWLRNFFLKMQDFFKYDPLDPYQYDDWTEKAIREEFGELADIKLRLMHQRGVFPPK